MSGTRLTKTGQPVLGTSIEVQTFDNEWLRVTVVGKGIGLDGHSLVAVWIESPDGERQRIQWPHPYWREVET